MPILCQIRAGRNLVLHLRTMPIAIQKEKHMTKEKFDLLSIHHHIKQMRTSRGANRGKSQEQCDRFNANEAIRHARKKGYLSILDRVFKGRLVSQLTDGNWVNGRKCIFLAQLALEKTDRTRLPEENVQDSRITGSCLSTARGPCRQWTRGKTTHNP